MCVFSWLNISLRNSLVVSQVPVLMPMDLMVEASPRRIFANAHTYHINSISVNSDYETYLSADDLRINLWHLEITDRSFSILYAVSEVKFFSPLFYWNVPDLNLSYYECLYYNFHNPYSTYLFLFVFILIFFMYLLRLLCKNSLRMWKEVI